MPIKTPSEIAIEIATNITDPKNNQNTAARVRAVLNDMNDSMLNATLPINISGIVAGGDLSGTYANPTVSKLLGNTIPANASGFLSNNGSGVLTWTAAGGVGTVTSVSVVTANGVSGSVATDTTTPAITLALGAITPSSVAATGTVAGSNLSGTNTGDQTDIPGNADSATTIAITDDVATATPLYPTFVPSPTGNQPTRVSSTGIRFTPSTGTLESTRFAGTLDGNVDSGTWLADPIGVGYGGTGGTTAIDGFNALAPTTALGDIIYRDGTDNTRLPGNTTTTQKVLTQTGDGVFSSAPVWSILNFVPYTGATANVDLNNKELTNVLSFNGNTITNGTGTLDLSAFTLTLTDNADVEGINTGDQTITLTGGVTGSGTGSFAATVVTNANLTGPITSVGNATSIASQTGTGTTFAMSASPTFTGVPSAPTAAPATNTTQIATTAFVLANAGTTYTFSTGLTDTANTITNNLSTGVSGGQSVIGGTAASNNLQLLSTSHATKGSVYHLGSGSISTNTAFGLSALTANTTGLSNSAFGNSSLPVNTIGVRNSAYGNQTLNANIGGTDNNAFGFQALLSNVSGLYSNAFGAYSLKSSTADKNTAFGDNTLQATTSGEGNTAIGYGAGYSNVTGANNVFIGRQAGFSETGSNKLYISNSTTVDPLIYGDFSTSIIKIHGSIGVGISPLAKLHVYSTNTTSGTFEGIFENGNGTSLRIRSDGSVYNNGRGSGNADNTAFGGGVLIANTTGQFNTGFGSACLGANTTGTDNTGYGYISLQATTGGSFNTSFGSNSSKSITTANYNTAVGYASLRNNVTGWGSTAIGYTAMFNTINSTSSGFNTGVGYAAMYTNTTGIENSAFGYNSMYSKGTGDYNSSFGAHALELNTGGESNTVFGSYGLSSNTGGSFNTTVGTSALNGNISGSSNVAIGYQAGRGETGSSKLYIDNQNRTSEALARSNSMFYGIFHSTVASQKLYINAGIINVDDLQTGNAGLATGDLYVDTAANALANGDLVVIRKV